MFWQSDGDRADALVQVDSTQEQQGLSNAGQQRLVGLAGTSEKQAQEQEYFGAGEFRTLSLADFRFVFDAVQLREIEQLIDRVARRARKRISRRQFLSDHGSQVDLRKSSRHSLRYAGRPMVLVFRRRKPRQHRFGLLLDISQSMDVYARLFMRFARVLMTVFLRSEAFVFNTDLHRLATGHTKLSEEAFERVINTLGKGWLGGTRIALSLESFNAKWLTRCVDSKTTVLIFSDGCDTATPDKLALQTSRIQRRAKKLIWVNPLLGRFEPGEADRYMDPVVPFVDSYCSAHNLNSLIELERELLS